MGRFAKTHDQTSCCWNSEAMATKKVSLLPPPAVATSPPRSPGELGTTFAAIPRADSPRTEAPLLGSLQASRATATAGGGASTARHGRSPLW